MASNSLTLRILGGQDVGPIDGFEYYGGEEREVTFQVMNEDTDSKFVIPTGITNLTLTFPGSSDDIAITLVDADNIDENDRSILNVTLDEDDTNDIISGWMKLEWDDGGAHRVAYAEFIQTKLTTGDA